MAEKKRRFFRPITRYFRELINEIKKIVWPTIPTTFKNTGTVLVSILLIGTFVFVLDTVLYKLFSTLMELAT